MQRTRREKLASGLSILGHPFLTTLLMVAVASAEKTTLMRTWGNLLLVAGVVVLPLGILIVVKRRRGAWETVDASRVQERSSLFWVGLGGLVVLSGYLWVWDRGSILLRGTLVTLGLVLACALSTRFLRLKVSLHLACAALAATVLFGQGQGLGWGLMAALPVLAWSRVVLGRHRWVETGVGAVLGVLAGLIVSY